MEYSEEEFLQISGIQHYAFCKRQWALIHIEQQWEDNYLTIDGDFFHNKAHDEFSREFRNNTLITRGLKVYSRKLGISGECDVVEFKMNSNGIKLYGRDGTFLPIPIEYKRGEPKEYNADDLQLCAQAMCLEEMLQCDIKYGNLFYGQTKHRIKIEFNDDIRKTVEKYVKAMHDLYSKGYTPKVKPDNHCKSCSLNNICIPKLNQAKCISTYIKEFLDPKE